MADEKSIVVAVSMRGGKRANLIPNEASDRETSDGERMNWDWWVGHGKSPECQFEGPWLHMAILAAKILRHPNTLLVAPNLYTELELTEEQESMY